MPTSKCAGVIFRIGPKAGTTYFVTFHLVDSLPAKKLAAFREQKKLWLALNLPEPVRPQISKSISAPPLNNAIDRANGLLRQQSLPHFLGF